MSVFEKLFALERRRQRLWQTRTSKRRRRCAPAARPIDSAFAAVDTSPFTFVAPDVEPRTPRS